MDKDIPEPAEAIESGSPRAEVVFAGAAFGFALFLLSQIGNQVTWSAERSLINQPGFWPVMAVFGMVVFGVAELWLTLRRHRSIPGGPIMGEVLYWIRALEFAGWFLVYVSVVPLLGYLPTTLLFCLLLTLRLGYRSRKFLFSSLIIGFLTVLIFKSFLTVKIPGGAVYEFLPTALQNFMIVYF